MKMNRVMMILYRNSCPINQRCALALHVTQLCCAWLFIDATLQLIGQEGGGGLLKFTNFEPVGSVQPGMQQLGPQSVGSPILDKDGIPLDFGRVALLAGPTPDSFVRVAEADILGDGFFSAGVVQIPDSALADDGSVVLAGVLIRNSGAGRPVDLFTGAVKASVSMPPHQPSGFVFIPSEPPGIVVFDWEALFPQPPFVTLPPRKGITIRRLANGGLELEWPIGTALLISESLVKGARRKKVYSPFKDLFSDVKRPFATGGQMFFRLAD